VAACRFKEREENVRLEIFAALQTLLRTTKLVSQARDADEDAMDVSDSEGYGWGGGLMIRHCGCMCRGGGGDKVGCKALLLCFLGLDFLSKLEKSE
jgi:hypothetical protein